MTALLSSDVCRGADKDTSNDIDYPLILINAASVKHWRDHAEFMFNSAKRPDMIDNIEKWIISQLKDLNGIDRERPFGSMLYLPPDFTSWQIPITYIPITNLDDALKTLAHDQGAITAVDGKTGWSNIRYGENFLVRTRRVGNYLFLAWPDSDETTLDRNFPDPAKLAARLSSQYDVAASLLIRNVQPALKKLFLETSKQAVMATLQQRDEEPESAYRLRRANGESWLELFEHVVMQGEEFTIGARISPDQHQANFDIEISGTPDSKLAKFFQGMAGKRTHFGNLISNRSTFTISISWQLSDKQRPLLNQFFEAAKKDIDKNAEKSGSSGMSAVVAPLFKVLQASAEAGHIDAIAQMTGDEPGKFALVAGAKLAGSRNLPTQVTELLQFAKDNASGSETLSKLELEATEIDSMPVHQLEINPPDKPGQRMFGETAHLYVCATTQAIWFAFGGDPALDALREAMAQVAQPQDPALNRGRPPFLFVTHASNWLSVGDDSNPGAVAFNERARAAFESTNDSMQLVIRPTESGVRLRIDFEEGFVALLGRSIAQGIEDRANRPRQDGQGQGPGGRRRPGQQAPNPPPAK